MAWPCIKFTGSKGHEWVRGSDIKINDGTKVGTLLIEDAQISDTGKPISLSSLGDTIAVDKNWNPNNHPPHLNTITVYSSHVTGANTPLTKWLEHTNVDVYRLSVERNSLSFSERGRQVLQTKLSRIGGTDYVDYGDSGGGVFVLDNTDQPKLVGVNFAQYVGQGSEPFLGEAFYNGVKFVPLNPAI